MTPEQRKKIAAALDNAVRDIASQEAGKAIQESQALSEGKYEERQKRAETRGLIESNLDKLSNRKLRRSYAKLVFFYLCWYSIVVAVLLVLSGFKILGFYLGDGVLEFLVGSTAAAAIGLVFAVTNGLFGGLNKPK